MAGFRALASEPDLHLSMYPAPHLQLVHLVTVYFPVAFHTYSKGFTFAGNHELFPRLFAFQIFEFSYMMHLERHVFFSTEFTFFCFYSFHETILSTVDNSSWKYVAVYGNVPLPFKALIVEKDCVLPTFAAYILHTQVLINPHAFNNCAFGSAVLSRKGFEHTVLHHVFKIVNSTTIKSQCVIIIEASDFRIVT